MSAFTFTPSSDENVIDSSIGGPSFGVLVQITLCTLVGNEMICSVSGSKNTHPLTTGMSCTPRELPASLTLIPTCEASIRVKQASLMNSTATATTAPTTNRRIEKKLEAGS